MQDGRVQSQEVSGDRAAVHLPAMGDAWRELFVMLDRLQTPGALDRAELVAHLMALEADECWIAEAAHFSPRGYARNLLRGSDCYEAYLMCWLSGQQSPVHDHAGSLCGVRVLIGTVTERRFERARCGGMRAATTVNFDAGCVCVSEDSDTHQIVNCQKRSCDLMTLHVYSPPLKNMRTYPVRELLPALARADRADLVGGDGI